MALLPSVHPVWMALTILTSHMTLASAEFATYVVHMDLSAMPRAFSGHHGWYTSVVAAAASDSIPATPNLIYVYDNAIHGFSARLKPSQLEQVKKSRGYLSCYRDMPVTVDTTHTPEFLHLSPDSGLWPASGRGEDVIIGVVDTGIWPESESFSDDGMTDVPARWKGACERGTAFSSSACNRKLIGARAFNKGLLAAVPNLTIAVNSPRDTDGHGTHTSSTAAGNYAPGASFFGYAPGTARGMAPRARLAMYKALWDEGVATSDVIAAIDQAISDGVDVISLSLGFDSVPLYKDPIAMAAFAAMEKGIFVATSAGNEGPDLRVLHNGTPWVTTIGAAAIDRDFAGVVDLGDGSSVVGRSLYPGRPASKHELPLVFMGSCDNKTLLKNVRHKMVVCDAKDSLGFATDQVESAEVDAAVFISEDVFVRFSFPGAIINPKDGKTILEYINRSSDPRATLRFRETILGTKPAPMVAGYTSRGPSASCPTVLKPDIVAPGTLILASWAQNSSVGLDRSHELYSPFNIISGTSMACPHAAGIAAMIKGARPGWSPAAIRSALVTTANHLDDTMMPIKDMGDASRPAATPLAMGSGHIEPNGALDPGLVYDASTDDYVRLLCAMKYTKKQIKIITRTYSFDCSNASLDLNYPSFIAFFSPNKTTTPTGAKVAREFRRTVTNVGDAAVTYNAKVLAMKGFSISVMPEKLDFHERYEKKSFAVIIEGRMGKKKDEVLHGSLTWVDDKAKYVVRSPIVATTITSARL